MPNINNRRSNSNIHTLQDLEPRPEPLVVDTNTSVNQSTEFDFEAFNASFNASYVSSPTPRPSIISLFQTLRNPNNNQGILTEGQRNMVTAFTVSRNIGARVYDVSNLNFENNTELLSHAEAEQISHENLNTLGTAAHGIIPPPAHPWLYLLGVTVFTTVGIGTGIVIGRRILDVSTNNPTLQQDSKELFRIFGYALKFIKL